MNIENLQIKLTDLEEEGIPEEHAKIFLEVAKGNKCIISTRAPGKACGMLLDQGYDGKGFHVKSKSCDWGPMAGFVCLDPFLNKNEVAGAMTNLKDSLHALRDPYDVNDVKSHSTALPISIDEDRLKWLRENLGEGTWHPEHPNEAILYQSSRITVIFLRRQLESKTMLWDLYFDAKQQYGVAPEKFPSWLLKATINRLEKEPAKKNDPKASAPKVSEADKKLIETFWELVYNRGYLTKSIAAKSAIDKLKKDKEFANVDSENYLPLMGLTNPYRPYRFASQPCNWGLMTGIGCLDPFFSMNWGVGALSNLTTTLGMLEATSELPPVVLYTAYPITIDEKQTLQQTHSIDKGGWFSQETSTATFYKAKPEGKAVSFVFHHRRLADGKIIYDVYFDAKQHYGCNVSDGKSILYANLAAATKLKLKEDPAMKSDPKKKEDYEKEIDKFWNLVQERNYLTMSEAAKTAINKIKIENKLLANDDIKADDYLPLIGLHPVLTHLNVLTGDYDLYAFWPEGKGDDSDRRIAGMQKNMAGKAIVNKENASPIGRVAGNISQRGYDLAQMINSRMPCKPKTGFPNRVFHSDEAGRPNIDSVDSAIFFHADGDTIYKVRNAEDLARLIAHHHGKYACFVNQGWEKGLKDTKLFPDKDWEAMLKWSPAI